MPEEKTLQDTPEELKEEGDDVNTDVDVDKDDDDEDKDKDIDTDTDVDTDKDKEDDFTPPTEEEYKKTLEERDNYKKGMLKAKEGLKKKPDTKESEFVTKADLQKEKEKTAIKAVLINNPEMDTNWAKFVEYIPKVSNSDDLETIKKKICAGYAGYKSTLDQKEDDEDKDAKAELSKTSGTGGTTPPPAQKERKSILNTKSTNMSDWYK